MTILTFSSERKYRRSPRSNGDPLLLPQKHDNNSFRSDYDQEEDEVGFDGASFSGAVFNLSTTIVGAGIMALPATVKELGLLLGLTMILLVAVLTESSIEMILRFGKASKAVSYSGVVGDAFGGTARRMLQLCVIVNNLGLLIVYMIIIGDVFSGTRSGGGGGVHHSGILEGWFGRHWWTSPSFILLLTTILVFCPLISFKRVDSLRYTSALSVALAVVFVAITTGITVTKLFNGSIGMPRLLPQIVDQASFWKLFTTVPVLVTAYICHYSIHPIENELKDPSQMKSIVRTSLTFCASVYLATSLFGFLLFGEQTLDDVLANFDADLGIPYGGILNDVVRVSYGIHLMLVFPVVFFSLRLSVNALLFPMAVPIGFDNKRFLSISIGLMGFIFITANFVRSIWTAFQFTGATAAISLGFIFPAAIALRDSHGIATKKDKILSWLLMFLAVTSSTIAISCNIYSIFNDQSG